MYTRARARARVCVYTYVVYILRLYVVRARCSCVERVSKTHTFPTISRNVRLFELCNDNEIITKTLRHVKMKQREYSK